MPQNSTIRPALAVSFCTSMSRPDAALALAAIHGLEGRRLSRAGAICVAGAGLNAAIFCDIVGRFYTVGPVPNANDVLPIGLALTTPMPPDPAIVKPVVDRRNEKGEPAYPRRISKASDTSQAEAMLRNGVTFTTDTAFVLSAPATSLAKCLGLLGVRELFQKRVKRLVLVDTGEPHQDVPALRTLLAEWPTPVFVCGKDVGDALSFPGESIGRAFAWTSAHPVADAYRAFKTMPYDAPSYDLAAVYFASRPDSEFFRLSEPGSVMVGDGGRLTFAAGGKGTVRSLSVDPAKRAQAVQTFVELTSAQPVAPNRRGRDAV
ncbi:MAG TPA: hypothetical protein VFV95_19850 [Vicinamibacterales bacterium]|nr:hypothetical protein [Vicinamibacterales bacterium]